MGDQPDGGRADRRDQHALPRAAAATNAGGVACGRRRRCWCRPSAGSTPQASASSRACAWSSASRSTWWSSACSPAAARMPTCRIPPPIRLRQHPGLGDRVARADHQRADRRAEPLGQADRQHVGDRAVLRERRRRWRRARSRSGRRRGARRRRRRSAHARSVPQVRRAAAPRRRRSCGCSRPRSPRCARRTGPCRGRTAPGSSARSTGRAGAIQVRIVSPPYAPCAPSSARAMWADDSQSTSWPGATSDADGEHVGHRPGRREQRGLVAEQPGDPLLERADGRVLAVDVVADLGARHRGAHRLGRRRVSGVAARGRSRCAVTSGRARARAARRRARPEALRPCAASRRPGRPARGTAPG